MSKETQKKTTIFKKNHFFYVFLLKKLRNEFLLLYLQNFLKVKIRILYTFSDTRI